MSRQHEVNLNNALAELLDGMFSQSQVRPENTDIIANKPSKRPDISITSKGRAPVVIEAECEPANNVENEAKERFQTPRLKNQNLPLEAVLALIYPETLRAETNLKAALSQTRLRYRVFYANEESFPEDGWLEGSVSDLADLIHLIAVPRSAFDRAADTLAAGIDGAVSVLEDSRAIHLTDQIFSMLGLADIIQSQRIPEAKRRELKNTQTRRIAGAIIANALIFHERIAGAHKRIQPIGLVCGRLARNPKQAALDAWESILDINYWPVFDAAKSIIRLLPAKEASQILVILKDAAESIQKEGMLYEHDLTGQVFQRLIVDRKYLAAFYTLPESASLLARLAVAKMRGIDWKDAQAIGQLRVADFACGTGALLSAVYDQIAARHERKGGDPAKLHPAMIQEVLYGFDVMPSAIHITSSTLSGTQPSVKYEDSLPPLHHAFWKAKRQHSPNRLAGIPA